jgi:hypothetical protein
MNGLLHVWVHYTQPIPEQIELYSPYPNANCLRCHDDARGFTEVEAHSPIVAELRSEETSCLSCHDIAHDMDGVKAGNFWVPEGSP